MLYLTGIIIDFFLMITLAGKKEKSMADKILAAWLFLIGIHLILFYLFITRQYNQFPQLLGLEIPFPLIHGPFLFLYTSYLTDLLPKKNTSLLHFLPFIFAYIPLLPFLFSGNDHKIFVYNHKGEGYEWLMIPMSIAVMISGITYILLSLKKLVRHRKNISDQFSNTERINLIWLRNLIIGLSCIWILVIFCKDEPVFIAVVLFIIFIGLFGMRQTNIFSHHPPVKKNAVAEAEIKEEIITDQKISSETDEDSNSEKIKYQRSILSESDMLFIFKRLTDLMDKERLFTNPELTLGETAQKLNIHPNYLSQVINSVAKKNFYDYINFQRVEEFNRLAQDPKNQKFTLLYLAFECGFNSKTSFNRNFKKIMGMSPSEYLKQINVNLNQAG